MSNYNNYNKNADPKVFEETFDYENIELNSANIQAILGTNSDFVHRQLFIHNNRNLEVSLYYIDGMINMQNVSDYIIKPLMQEEKLKTCSSEADVISAIDEGTIYYADVKKRTAITDVLSDLITGSTVIIFNRQQLAYTFDTKGYDKRGVQEPSVENVIKGSKDTFTETIRTNTSICRRKIKSPNLVIEETIVGKQSKTPISIVYLKNIANPELVNKVRERLDKIDISIVLTSSFIEEFLVDAKSFVFPQIQSTERPDKFCANIAEGRVGVLIDGLPIAYIIPATFFQFLQAPEDYSMHWIISSIIRIIRIFSMFITLLLPAFYVSITTFHQEMIPSELTFSIIAAKQGVPFPMFVEVLLMLGAFELLIEAGLRLPKTIGQTVSIVGALVVGQAAVEAKLISPSTVIFIAITAIAGFVMPNQDFSNAVRLWRFIITISSCIIGIYGMVVVFALLLHQLCNLESYGVPYLSPFVGSKDTQRFDSLLRFPISTMKERPKDIDPINKKR